MQGSPPYRVRGRLCAGTTVGFPGFPRRAGRAGFKPAPTEPRYAVSGRTRGVTLTPSASSGQAPPSPVEGEGVRAPFHARYSVVSSGRGHEGGERPGCVESMGPAQGSGSCQCCLSFSLILRSAMVSSAGAGFSSSMRSDPRAFLRMAALAFPSRRRCVRVRRVRGRRTEGVSSWVPSAGSGLEGWVSAPSCSGAGSPIATVRGWVRASAGTTIWPGSG